MLKTLCRKLRLYLITDDKRRPAAQLADVVGGAIAGGVTAVQFREKQLTGAPLVEALNAVCAECRRRDVPLLLNADILSRLPVGFGGAHFQEIASSEPLGFAHSRNGESALSHSTADSPQSAQPGSAIEADIAGIHAGARTWPLPPVRPPLLIGYSAHRADEIPHVLRAGADFVTMSPVFETSSKPGQPGGGPELVRAARAAAPEAVIVALGGIHEQNAGSLVRAGADGIAVISSVMAARNPFAQAARLREMVENALDA